MLNLNLFPSSTIWCRNPGTSTGNEKENGEGNSATASRCHRREERKAAKLKIVKRSPLPKATPFEIFKNGRIQGEKEAGCHADDKEDEVNEARVHAELRVAFQRSVVTRDPRCPASGDTDARATSFDSLRTLSAAKDGQATGAADHSEGPLATGAFYATNFNCHHATRVAEREGRLDASSAFCATHFNRHDAARVADHGGRLDASGAFCPINIDSRYSSKADGNACTSSNRHHRRRRDTSGAITANSLCSRRGRLHAAYRVSRDTPTTE